MRRIILGLSIAGTLLFGSAFILSWLNPILIERAAGTVVRMEVERKMEARLDALSGAPMVGLAQRALGRTESDMEHTRAAIRKEVPAKVVQVVAAMHDADCECRKRLTAIFDGAARQHLLSLSELRTRLTSLVESAYANVTAQLLREFRIFTASNAAALVALGIVALTRRRAGLQLMLPAAVLVGGVTATGGLYLFAQNWLHAIVFNDYVGMAYAGWLCVVVLLLADILGNRARVSTRVVNGLLQTVGAGLTAVPC
jgi:hypothetical protein